MHTNSAGVGRTGTFITIDIVLKQVEKQGLVDIHNIVNRLRYQRPHIVQTLVCVCVARNRNLLGQEFITGTVYLHP